MVCSLCNLCYFDYIWAVLLHSVLKFAKTGLATPEAQPEPGEGRKNQEKKFQGHTPAFRFEVGRDSRVPCSVSKRYNLNTVGLGLELFKNFNYF